MLCQLAQTLVFGRGPRVEVDDDITPGDLAVGFLFDESESRFDPSDNLFDPEWFGDVIDGALLEDFEAGF